MTAPPAGEIVQVDRGNNTVWINLGRADSLSQQVSFSVFPADLSNLKLEGNKGSIEVTHVLGDHLAEARVTDDRLADPILPGDKVYTPVWNPGQPRHFALAGFFDIDGSGKNALPTVMNLIKTNGGVIDCWIEETPDRKFEQKGRGITPNTSYLILGTPPDEKADSTEILAFTQMRKMADHLRLPIMQFNDLLQAMGWKNAAPVVRYGRGGSSHDFRARPDPNRPQKSGGNSAFPEREPPKSSTTPAGGSNGSSYFRY